MTLLQSIGLVLIALPLWGRVVLAFLRELREFRRQGRTFNATGNIIALPPCRTPQPRKHGTFFLRALRAIVRRDAWTPERRAWVTLALQVIAVVAGVAALFR
jgi:hypothetical protein